MKKVLFVITLMFLFMNCSLAQEQTLFGSGEFTSGGFGGPVIKFTQIKDQSGILVGGHGAWLINHSVYIGGGGYGLVNEVDAGVFDRFGNEQEIKFGYGGFEIGLIFMPQQLLHIDARILVGAGGVKNMTPFDLDEPDTWVDLPFDENHKTDAFFVLEPEVNIELNITTFIRMNAGISYRYVDGIDLNNLSDDDMSGMSVGLGFKFGAF